MDSELLKILVCPKTKKNLILADAKLLDSINSMIRKQRCHDISGEIVKEEITEGLFQPETGIFYLIRDGIPLLIYDNAIKING